MALSIVIPAKSEEENLRVLLPALARKFPRAEILLAVPSDEKARLGKIFPKARLVPSDGGFGGAVVSGLSKCKSFPALVLDGDLSHSAGDARRLARIFSEGELDLAIGSRYCPGGRIVGWTFTRRALSISANFFARTLYGSHARDLTSGFRVYSQKAAGKVVFYWKSGLLPKEAYPFQLCTLVLLEREGLSIGEAPIEFRERKFGSSKTFSFPAIFLFFKSLVFFPSRRKNQGRLRI